MMFWESFQLFVGLFGLVVGGVGLLNVFIKKTQK